MSSRPDRTIVLWDIDNTLLYTGGAGSIGMTRAFEELYGIANAFASVEFSGRTDTAIFRDACRAHRLPADDSGADVQRFVDAYVPHLAVALDEVRGALMPGVAGILDALSACGDVVQGLGTGNFRRGGELKLRRYGIDVYFHGLAGGFGDDSESREEMIRLGIERLVRGARNGGRIVVVGDTPHDVAAGKANGAFVLAVATGRNSVDELVACGADAALPDLSAIDHVVALMRGL